MNKYLIINADDFGLSESVNRGIVEVVQLGNITSVSAFANLPGFDDAVHRAKNYLNSTVGLHFNLTYGSPISHAFDVPTLVAEDGSFKLKDLDWTNPGWTADQVKLELYAQFAKLQSAGLCISHIDSHHYVHNYNVVFDVVLEFACSMQIPVRRTRKQKPRSLQITTDYLVCHEYFNGDGLSKILKAVEQLNDGVTEINCHPGYSDEVVKAISAWSLERETELSVFTSPDIGRTIRDLGISLISHSDLMALKPCQEAAIGHAPT